MQTAMKRLCIEPRSDTSSYMGSLRNCVIKPQCSVKATIDRCRMGKRVGDFPSRPRTARYCLGLGMDPLPSRAS